MLPPPDAPSPPYRRGDLVRCSCGNPFIAASGCVACGRCGGHDVQPLRKLAPPTPFRL